MVKNILLKWENSSEKRKKYHGDPLSFPSPPALNLSQHQGLFQ